jgi:hypothetical protein
MYRTMYDIKTIIASFLRKLQQNFAQSQYIFRFTPRNVLLWDFTKKFPKFSQRNIKRLANLRSRSTVHTARTEFREIWQKCGIIIYK